MLQFGLDDRRSPQKLLSFSPLLSELFDRRVAVLSGWSDFNDSIKAFQVLGLVGERVRPVIEELEALQQERDRGNGEAQKALYQRQYAFLVSRRDAEGKLIFRHRELTDDRVASVDLVAIALREVFARRPVICTTSSNFGLALYDVLTRMQTLPLNIGDRAVTILNRDEGSLAIWCPRCGSDIMRDEKDDILRSKLESGSIKCQLCRYDSRAERDLKAIVQVLETGGYFFPTTPQSEANIKTLLETAISHYPNLEQFLLPGRETTLTASIRGGMWGAMVPYLSLLDEFIEGELSNFDTHGCQDKTLLEIYNPTSIGATLAAFVEADLALHDRDVLSSLKPQEKTILDREFPHLSSYLSDRGGCLDFTTSIRAVPDHHIRPGIAGAFDVSSPHIPGDGKKFMGLGSSSFPNCSLPQATIDRSIAIGGGFRGGENVHPTTHTMGYIAAALAFASELQRQGKAAKLPELAGSFALAGVLQIAVEANQVSPEEVAWSLRRSGIAIDEFIALNPEDYTTPEEFLDRARSEGELMAKFATSFLAALSMDRDRLDAKVADIRASKNGDRCVWFPAIVAQKTGNYCLQPSPKLKEKILRAIEL